MEEFKQQVLDMMNTAVEAAGLLLFYAEEEKKEVFGSVGNGLLEVLTTLVELSEQIKVYQPLVSLPEMSKSTQISLIRILSFYQSDLEKAAQKVRYEFIPLLEEMRMNYYYWIMVYPSEDAIKKYYEEDINTYFQNPYLEEAERTGEYKYDASIIVLAYNKLDYTRACVASLKKYLPRTFRYELIFINHGSTDGTKEFFESQHPDKQIDIAVNGGGILALNRCVEGKYTICISNDVLVTENALDNMYQCIISDNKIARVVPTTPNVSNFQTIQLQYSNIDEMYSAAAENNKLDYFRHEQRVRLCNPIDIVDNRIARCTKVLGGFFSKSTFYFPDDISSLIFRRAGYKNVLAKDAFCYHFGSATLKDEINEDYYLRGRIQFMNSYGVDPWGKGSVYDYELFQELSFSKMAIERVLGINCGLGSNALKVKEQAKEELKQEGIELVNYTNNSACVKDLEGISDRVCLFSKWEELSKLSEIEQFEYIVWECDDEVIPEEYREALQYVKKCLKGQGVVLIRGGNVEREDDTLKEFNEIRIYQTRMIGKWLECRI